MGGHGCVSPCHMLACLYPRLGLDVLQLTYVPIIAHELDEHDLVKLYNSHYRRSSPNLK